MYLGVTLSKLDDFDNACAAYDKALQLDSKDALILLNYAITLLANDELEQGEAMYARFTQLRSSSSTLKSSAAGDEAADAHVQSQVAAVEGLLSIHRK